MTKYLILTIAALLVALYFVGQRCSVLADDRARLKSNQSALLSDVAHYRTENGKNAASVEALTLTNAELRANCATVETICNDLKISLKRLQRAAVVASASEIKIATVTRDTTIVYNVASKQIKVFDYADVWFNVNGVLCNDSVHLDEKSRDTLSVIVHRVPYKFLFFRCGTKKIQVDAVNSNPHNRIEKIIYVEKSR